MDALAIPTIAAIALLLAGFAARRDLGVTLKLALPVLLTTTLAVAFAVRLTGISTQAALVFASLASLAALVAEIDRRSHLIPNPLVVGIALLALVAPFNDALWLQFLGAAAVGGLFIAVRLAFAGAGRAEALGLGDVKLAAALGGFLGIQHGLVAVALAGIATLSVSLVAQWNGGALQLRGAPFGVGLAAALLAVSAARLWGLA